jgi:transcriptional regulator with XRE-family HTH domain
MRRYVGERIKKLREAQEMTLDEVSGLTGIEPRLLAAYEEGTAVPAIGPLIQLSRVFGSKVEGLLHGGGTVSESLTICRSGDSFSGVQGDTEQSYSYSSLTRPGTAGHLMEPFLLSFDPRVPQGAAITHPGQEFVYIVDGTLELSYDGRLYRLETGDSAYLDCSRPHTYHGLGEQVAHMLAVVSSP